MEKLFLGRRINNAANDAADLAISEKMCGQVYGLDRASHNTQDDVSLIQTAECALNETHDILQWMRKLVVQAGNGTNKTEDSNVIQDEIDGENGSLDVTLQIGSNSGQQVNLTIDSRSACPLLF
ncbi:hypothetical protein AAB109_05600 [Priestia megaterium]|nr:hypothetical protein [Priestia megaterium]